jgi:hypothetical protein
LHFVAVFQLPAARNAGRAPGAGEKQPVEIERKNQWTTGGAPLGPLAMRPADAGGSVRA